MFPFRSLTEELIKEEGPVNWPLFVIIRLTDKYMVGEDTKSVPVLLSSDAAWFLVVCTICNAQARQLNRHCLKKLQQNALNVHRQERKFDLNSATEHRLSKLGSPFKHVRSISRIEFSPKFVELT